MSQKEGRPPSTGGKAWGGTKWDRSVRPSLDAPVEPPPTYVAASSRGDRVWVGADAARHDVWKSVNDRRKALRELLTLIAVGGDLPRSSAHVDAFRREMKIDLWSPPASVAIPAACESYLYSKAVARVGPKAGLPRGLWPEAYGQEGTGRRTEAPWARFVDVLRGKPWQFPWRGIVFAGGALGIDPYPANPDNAESVAHAVKRLHELWKRHRAWKE